MEAPKQSPLESLWDKIVSSGFFRDHSVRSLFSLLFLFVAVSLAILQILIRQEFGQKASAEENLGSTIDSSQKVIPEFISNELLIKLKKDAREKIKEGNPKDTGIDSLNGIFQQADVREFKKVAKSGKNSKTDHDLFSWYKVTLNIPGEKIEGKFDPVLGVIASDPVDGEKANSKARVNKSGVPAKLLLQQLITKLKKDQNIEEVSLNYIFHAFVTPNDPYYGSGELWGMLKITPENAWDQNTGSATIVVADIDTGVDRNHEDLAGNMWVNSAETPGNGVDDDGNGYVDDYYGWDYVSNDGDPMDDHGHGSHTVGTIAGTGNNGVGVVGVNWGSRIMALKFLGSDGSGSTYNGILALQYAADMGARVSSNSWGCSGCSDPAIDDAIKYEHDRGMVTVVAAGNNSDDALSFSPANSDYAITVAATDSNDLKASFSNYGERIDVAAPGVNILSVKASGGTMCSTTSNYCSVSGTSMATPHVAGLAALLLAKDPTLTNEEIRQIIRTGATDLGVSGKDSSFGYGRINVNNSFTAGKPLTPIITSPKSRTSPTGSFSVLGSAEGTNFASYKIEVGTGRAPTSWTTVTNSTAPVSNNVLGTINPLQQLSEGYNIIRVSAVNASGQTYQYQVNDIWVDNFDASITAPAGLVSLSTIDVYGNAQTKNGLGFANYNLEWGTGSTPTSWSTTGITLVNGGNSPVSNEKLATWDSSGLTDGQTYTLRLTVTSSLGTSVQSISSATADKDLVSGWPKVLPAAYNAWFGENQAAFADLDGDGQKEIIAQSPAGQVNVFRRDGTNFPNFPVSVDPGWYLNMPVNVADLDNNGKKEIIVAAMDPNYNSYARRIYIFNSDGARLPNWPISQTIWFSNGGTPSIADLDGDGKKELIVMEGMPGPSLALHVYRLDGSELAGFPKTVNSNDNVFRFGAPTLSDINNDGRVDIIVGVNHQIFVYDNTGQLLTGWPYSAADQNQYGIGNMAMTFVGAPAVGDLDGDGQKDIFAVGHMRSCFGCDAYVYALKKDGSIMSGYPIKSGALWEESVLEGPSIVDSDNDGKDEGIVNTGALRVYGVNGLKLTGIPASSLGSSISDVDGDGQVEYSFVNSTKVGMVDNNGSSYFEKYLLNYGRQFHTPPIIGDLDNNGRMELLAFSDQSYYFGNEMLYLWNIPSTQTAKYEWPMFGFDPARTSKLIVSALPTPTPTQTPTPAPPDTTLPAVSITSPLNGSKLPSKGSVKVNTNASDTSGIAKIEIFIDGGSVKTCNLATTCSYTWSMTKVAAGTHTIRAMATDNSANKNTNSTTISVTK